MPAVIGFIMQMRSWCWPEREAIFGSWRGKSVPPRVCRQNGFTSGIKQVIFSYPGKIHGGQVHSRKAFKEANQVCFHALFFLMVLSSSSLSSVLLSIPLV